MNKLKIIVSGVLILGMLSLSGCFVTKAGNYVSEKSKAAWSGTKSFFGADEDSNQSFNEVLSHPTLSFF